MQNTTTRDTADAAPSGKDLHPETPLDLGFLSCKVSFASFPPTQRPAALPAAYEHLMAHAHAANCRYWLQDIRRRASNDPATTAWLLSEYFPAMAVRLGPRLCVAYLISPILHQSIREAPGFADVGAEEGQPFTVALFGDEGAAVAWLHAQQQSQGAAGGPAI